MLASRKRSTTRLVPLRSKNMLTMLRKRVVPFQTVGALKVEEPADDAAEKGVFARFHAFERT